MTTEKTSQLFQKAKLYSPVHFNLLRGRELEIASQIGRNKQVYKIDLLALRAPSERVVSVAWKWWLISLGGFLMTVILVLGLSYLQFGVSAVLTGIFGILGSLSLAALAWKKGSRQQVFYSRHSNVPLVSLHLGVPNKNEFQKFVSLLEQQIEALRQEFNLSQDQELAGEMRTLRRLANDGILSPDEYENSKEVLFQKH